MIALPRAIYRLAKLAIALLIITSLPGHTLPAAELALTPELLAKRDSAIDWLIQQLVPNSTVPLPAPNRRKLIISYRVPTDHPAYPYLAGRSYIYDDALAVIAFTMTKHYLHAESTLLALNRLVDGDGAFWFGYNTQNNWPSSQDHDGANQRTGATAWVGYSIAYYLQARLEDNKNFLSEDPIAERLLQFAEVIASGLLKNQVTKKDDLRYGLITGGVGTYRPRLVPDSNQVSEDYDGSPVGWISTEHNIDAYFFLRDLGRITNKSLYKDASALIQTELLKLWDPQSGQFYQGIKEHQAFDPYLPLDAASWGALFLMAVGEHKKARLSLSATDRFRSKSGASLVGYAPYFKDPIYEDPIINQHFYPNAPRMTWSGIEFVWGEGSLGVAAAYSKSGDPLKARAIIEAVSALEVDGGIRYASHEIPFQFSTFPSVASTAWLVIAVQLLSDPADLFWGE